MGGIFGDRPCESINRKLRPLSVPFVPPIKTLSESGKKRPWQSFRQGPRRLGPAGLGWARCWAPKTRPQSPPLKTAKRSGTAAPNGQRRTKNDAVSVCSVSHSSKRGPRAYPPKQGNAAARRPQTSQKWTKNGALRRPKMGRLNPVRNRLWQSFHHKYWAGLG